MKVQIIANPKRQAPMPDFIPTKEDIYVGEITEDQFIRIMKECLNPYVSYADWTEEFDLEIHLNSYSGDDDDPYGDENGEKINWPYSY